MSKTRKRTEEQVEESELFSDSDFDLDDFVEEMEHENAWRRKRTNHRSSRQRIDDLRESLWLRGQLEDWQDWED
jgi:hypothetical protein